MERNLKNHVISLRAKSHMQYMVESKLHVVTLKKEEWESLSVKWNKAVNGKGNIKKWTLQG